LGKPCVASDKVRLAQDIISDGESGLLIDPRSPESLAQAAIRLASKPEQSQAMGRRVQQTVRHRFKLESSVAQLETLYEEALREKRPARWYDIAGRSVSH
jgi:glycosyltransferase involved in cell wall biosynthesis